MKENKSKEISVSGLLVRVILLALIAAAVIVFLTCFKLENIEVRSGNYYSAEEIKAKLITRKTDEYAVLFAYRINSLECPTLAFVEKIDVELVDKNSVIIYVYDKAVTGCIEHMGQYFFFDREGIIVDCLNYRPDNIPQIKGLEFASYVMNSKLDPGSSSVFDTILEILLLLDKNGLYAEDITFGIRNEVTLHIDGNEILLGKSDSYDFKINNIAAVLEAAGEDKYRFDFRNYSTENMEIYAKKLE